MLGYTKDEPVVQLERKKIPFPINSQRRAKADAQNKELPQQERTATVKKSVIEQIKTGQKSVTAGAKRLETERPPLLSAQVNILA